MPLILDRPQTMFMPGAAPPRPDAKVPHFAVQPVSDASEKPELSIPYIDLSYDNNHSESSARNLVYAIRPKWRQVPDELEFTKFTDGITNTLLRIARRRPGASQEEVDNESVLMRAYGNNTDLIIDRDREAQSHALLAKRGMAPSLMARFSNGLLYGYISGKPCTPDDLTREEVWRGVAKKLAEWHARVPVSAVTSDPEQYTKAVNGHVNGFTNGTNGVGKINGSIYKKLEHRSPEPNLWSVLQKWVDALPCGTEAQRSQKTLLQHEIERTFEELDTTSGIGEQGLVFGHLDLLSGNVIMLPTKPDAVSARPNSLPVTFIDYEYATPCPAVFDIANHFAEWAGFDLDYDRIPTRSARRGFLEEYVTAYNQHASSKISESIVSSLEADIDRWRGIPGLYWGIWSLIQATISEIDFDYAHYAEQRLDEYWAWRAQSIGKKVQETMVLRERRWSQD